MEHPFTELVKKYGGFEITLGFRDDEDHILGGTGNTVWYCILKKRSAECWIGERNGEVWADRHLVKKKELKQSPAAPGTAIKMVEERAYFKQQELAASGRKPTPVKLYGHDASHYVFSFGARAYEVLDEFGVTVHYSNIDDETAGYRLRNVLTGADVQLPKLG